MSSSKELIKKLNDARRELLDLGLRNSLINYKPTKKRGIEVVDERSADLYELLVVQGKSMSFLPKIGDIGDEGAAGNESDSNADNSDEDNLRIHFKPGADPLRDRWLQTSLSAKNLESKLLATHLLAKSHIEERGVNILFLAMGMMHWRENDSSTEDIKAPLILVPVNLERTTALEKFKLSYTGEEIETNISIETKLLNDFRIKFPPLAGTDELNCSDYFDSIREATRPKKAWHVADDEVHLGFFSFGKYLIYKDLDPDRWPEGKRLDSNRFLRAILLDGFRENGNSSVSGETLDTRTSHDALPQVLDADGTQIEAIYAAQEGQNIVIQGHPELENHRQLPI